MAQNLSAFFKQNAKQVENQKIIVSDRFTDEDGKPMKWEITCISASENQKIRKNCTRNKPVVGKRGQYTQEFDPAAYQARLATQCVVFPNLNDKDLQNSYGAMDAEQLISAMLTPGEFDDLILSITDLCGFKTEEELIDEAKN